MTEVVITIVSIIVGFIGSFIVSNTALKGRRKDAEAHAQTVLDEANAKAKVVVQAAEVKAKDISVQAKQDVDREARELRKDFQRELQKLNQKEENLDRKLSQLENREKDLHRGEKEINAIKEEAEKEKSRLKELITETQRKLESVAGLSMDQAKRELLDSLMEDVKMESAKQVQVIENEAKEKAEQGAKRIMAMAMARQASDYVSEGTVHTVNLPNDELKGRLIGREGRNIRAIEAATGVDLIIDDTPECITVSSFDPVRREIARLAIERLIQDGRIHPGRIEEVVERVKKEVDKRIKEFGERACYELGLTGIHPEVQKLIGTLNYRTSYSQNQYYHSIEVGFLVGAMAAEMGIPTKIGRRAGLLHDIGKAMDHSMEGSHAILGAEFAKKHGEHADIVHAIRAHHEEEKPSTVLAHLVITGDALSGGRPGARREIMRTYTNRLDELEKICNSFPGVEQTFAIQAGREVRVMVENSRVNDEQAIMMSREIAARIEREMTYPGQIRVTVIRETRAVGLAK